jgi:hypothetical protein
MSVTTPTATKYGFSTDFSPTTDADELFIKHSIPELRSLEKRTRFDNVYISILQFILLNCNLIRDQISRKRNKNCG